MALTRFLADTSVLVRLDRPLIEARVEPYRLARRLVRCAPVEFELGFMSRNAAELRDLSDELLGLPVVSVDEGTFRRALEVQILAAEKGIHRALSLVDLLVAAAAEIADLTVLHYDADFDRIAKLTGQPTEWVVKRGTAD